MTLKEKAIKGALWSSIGTIGAGLLNFIITIILARLLIPADFGLLEILIVFTVIAECFIDSGFSQAIIKDNDATDVDLSSVFYFNLAIAITLYFLLYNLSPIISYFYNEPKLLWLSRVVFLVIIFDSLSIVQNANFARNLNFKSPAIASILAIIISAVVSITMAYNDYGVWALVSNLVLFRFLKMLFFWLFSNWRPILAFSMTSIKRYFKFGSNLLIQGLIDKLVSNLESLLIGRVYTKSDLGYFSQARKLDSYIIQTSSSVIQRVTYPVLSKISNEPNKLKKGYRQILQLNMFVLAPILFFTIASSDNVLYCLFGEKWIQSTPYLRLWCICGFLVSFYSVFINIFLVKDKTRLLLKLSMIRQFIRVVAIVVFIKISIMSLMYTIVATTLLSALLYSYIGGKLIDYRISEILIDIYKTLTATFIASTIVYYIPFIINLDNIYFLLAIQLTTMITIYILASTLLQNPTLQEAKRIIKSFIRK